MPEATLFELPETQALKPAPVTRPEEARERAVREREARVEEALRRPPAVQAAKERRHRTLTEDKRPKVTEAQVSTTDPEVQVVKMPDGGFRPAYNLRSARLRRDVDSQVIVGVAVTAAGTRRRRAGQALPMVEQIIDRTEPKVTLCRLVEEPNANS